MIANIKETLFWIFLIISMILLIWNVFGNSPAEFIVLVAIIFMVVLKIWSMSDRQIVTEFKMKSMEDSIKEGFNKIRKDIGLIKNKLKVK